MRAPESFKAASTDLVSRKSTVLTVMCVSASFIYSFLNSANWRVSVTPERMEKDSSSVLPMVRLMSLSVGWYSVAVQHVAETGDDAA